jgi:putative flippase GtrA
MEGLEFIRLPPSAKIEFERMRGLVREFIGYGAASGCALAVDVLLLWILVTLFSFGYIAAATVSFVAGASVAYILSIRLAFKDHRLNDGLSEFVGFFAIGTLGLAINAGVIAVAVNYLGLHYLIAKCVAAGCTFLCNFIARRQLLFVRPVTSPRELSS